MKLNHTTEQIKAVAAELDCGMRAFVHLTSGEFIFVPNADDLIGIDLNAWKDDIKLLKKKAKEYYEIEKWWSSQAFDLMREFAEQLQTNEVLQSKLFKALNKNKPFREFKFVIDNSGEYRQAWFDFKNAWQQEYVARQLGRIFRNSET